MEEKRTHSPSHSPQGRGCRVADPIGAMPIDRPPGSQGDCLWVEVSGEPESTRVQIKGKEP